MYTNHFRKRLATAAAIATTLLALAACGGGDTSPTAAEPAAGSALACVQQGYPCRWSEVDATVAQRSDTLGNALRDRLVGGQSTAEAAAWLRTQDTLAELQFDDEKLRFRLRGGRAVWVSGLASLRPQTIELGAPSEAPASHERASILAAGGRARVAQVIRPGAASRSAIVLAPYAWENEFMRADHLAGLLGSLPDYSGQVRLRQNLAKADSDVDVGEFRGWDAFDVVTVVTHAGELCWDEKTGLDYHECKSAVVAQVSTNAVIDAIEAANVGVELIKLVGHDALMLTPDFFRHEYPNGLDARLVVLDACLTWHSELRSAIPGATGVMIGWEGIVNAAFGKHATNELFELLVQGLDVKESFELLQDALQQTPGVRLHATDRHLRIRDLITVVDAHTNLTLSDDSGIEVGMRPGDGQPDHMLLEVFVDGIRPEIADAYHLDVLLNGTGLASYPVGARAEQVGEFRWKMQLEVPLGIDAQPAQVLPLQFSMRLPGWGTTLTRPSPRVNEAATRVQEWLMTSTTVQRGVGSTTTKLAEVVWELEPDTPADARYVYYRVKSGSLTVSYEGEVNNCRVSHQQSLDLATGEAENQLKFDLADNPPLFTGFGTIEQRAIEAQGTCSDGSTLRYETKVGGAYLYAKDLSMSGTSGFHGYYHDGARLPTVIEFQFSKLR